jgi:putative ABC transport system permease protein
VKLWEFLGAAVETLWANRMRSILTMLGIVIGTAAVIAIFAIGQSAAAGIQSQLATIGNPGIIIYPDFQVARANRARLQWSDVLRLRSECASCSQVFPRFGAIFTTRSGHKQNAFLLVSGTDYVSDFRPLAEGRRFDADDVDSARSVAIIEYDTKRELFGDRSAIGEEIRVGGHRFTVVGVFTKFSVLNNGPGGGSTYVVYIPYTTYHLLPGSTVRNLQVYPAPGASVSTTTAEVYRLLQQRYGTKAKYTAFDFTKQVGSFLTVIQGVALGISAIGGIALVVGGIGVMNIMLVSVNERTREIGIRKAIGAKASDIVMQFLVEAAAITLIGGLIGILIGAGSAIAANSLFVTKLTGTVATIEWLPIIVSAAGFSILIGVIFGTYPAIRASRLSPVDCLRHE